MLSLARVLVREPKLLITDELSLGLAPVIIDEVYETLGDDPRVGLLAARRRAARASGADPRRRRRRARQGQGGAARHAPTSSATSATVSSPPSTASCSPLSLESHDVSVAPAAGAAVARVGVLEDHARAQNVDLRPSTRPPGGRPCPRQHVEERDCRRARARPSSPPVSCAVQRMWDTVTVDVPARRVERARTRGSRAAPGRRSPASGAARASASVAVGSLRLNTVKKASEISDRAPLGQDFGSRTRRWPVRGAHRPRVRW